MIKSQVKKHRQAEQSDKHLVVNGVENLMVDGRGKCRPFGLARPKTAPTLEVIESGGELRRDAKYSYCISYFDSYHNAESEASPVTAFVSPGSGDDYRTVSVGKIDETTGEYHLNIVKVSGTNLSKVDNYYVGKCIAVLIENDDRPTPYSQWQYRKITGYEWDGANEVGVFEVARDFINIDTDPEDQDYEVRLSDMDMEEGEVGGKSAGNRKLTLDPNASTDISSYRMKVIRIVQGVGKGQSRFILDATLNSLGLVEITVSKPWKKKPKFVDPTLRQTQEKQESLKTRKDAKNKFFNQNWSSSYVIFDPLRFNGLCFDGEVESRDKKTGRITISGLGFQQSILTGNVIRFIQGKGGASKIVISLENSNSNIDWADEDSLVDKRLRITSGPGAGKEYVITASEESGENSVKLTLGIPRSDGEASIISGVPTAKSTYVIYTADAENASELVIAGANDETPEKIAGITWGINEEYTYRYAEWDGEKPGSITDYNINLREESDGWCVYILDSEMSSGPASDWPKDQLIDVVPLEDMGTAPEEPRAPWTTTLKEVEEYGEGAGYVLHLYGWPYWLKDGKQDQAKGYEHYLINPIKSVRSYEISSEGDPNKIQFSSDYKGNVTIHIKDPAFSLGEVANWPGKRIDITPLVGYADPYEEGEVWTTNIRQGRKIEDGFNNGYAIDVDGWPYWLKNNATPKKGYETYAFQNRLWGVELWSVLTSTQTGGEIDGDDVARIYVNDINFTGIYAEEEKEIIDPGTGNTEAVKTNANAVDGLYTVSFPVASPKGKGHKQYKARITRFIHDVGIDATGNHYIEVIGMFPRLYPKPRKANQKPDTTSVEVLEPVPGEPINIYGANTRDGFYTGWRALFINTTEIGGNKQKLKVKEARVVASFDATGEIIVDKEVAGVKAGWQVVLYSEYTSCLGTCINSGEKAEYYRKGKANYAVYDDYAPLEPFASPEDDEYTGWTLEVLAKGKTKKNGSTKYTKAPSRYRNKQKRTVIKYYGASRRAYVHQSLNDGETWHDLNGEPFDPKLNGNEFIWLYDSATSIEKMFDEENDDSVANEVGCKIKVKGIKRCPLDGVDKIRLYRAPEATGAYRLVVDLENKDQEYVDNIPEDHLTTEINIEHVAPPPCGKVCEYKGRFILGGAIKNNPVVKLVKGGHASVYAPDYGSSPDTANPVIEKYLYTDGGTFSGRALRVAPAVGVLCNKDCGTVIPQVDDTNTEKIKVGLVISEPPSDGIIAWCERRQFSGVFQRSRVVPEDSSGTYKDTDWVFLSPSASGDKEDYRRSVLCFADRSGAQQRWPFFADKNDSRYEPKTKQFTWQDKKVTLPVLSGTIYPVPFQIRTAVWVIFRRAGQYYYVDDESHTPKEIKGYHDFESGMTYLNVSVNQGENFNNLSYHVGGNAAEAVTVEDLYGFGAYGNDRPKDEVPTTEFRVYAITFSLENEDIVSCYVGADAEVLTYQEPNAYKPVMTIPECVEASSSASVYSSNGGIIEDPPMKKVLIINEKVYRIVIWDKEYTGENGTATLSARENAKAVYFTAATDGETEKVDLPNSYVFNDGFGTDVTAVAPTNSYVLVFKQRGIYALDPDGPSIGLMSNDIGCIATDSVALGRSGLYWMAEGRRIMRSDFEHGTDYVSAPVQPWFDGIKDFDGWYVDKDNLLDLISTYDVDRDEYIMFVPAKKGAESRLICLCFCDQFQMWYRVEDDILHSDNKADCAFRFEGGGAYCGENGIYINNNKRPGYAAWLWRSILRDEGNSGVMKHVKRIQIINVITDQEPSGTAGEPKAGFEFYKEMRSTPEGSYQASDAHTVRGVLTNRFAQLVHVGLRAFIWQFKFFGQSYVKLHDFVLQYRSKGEAEMDGWGDTPN